MISFISSWAQQIIFAVIIGTILQMLLPEGKNKKYIKIVIGIYVLFAVISPVIGKNIDLNLNEFNLSVNSEESNLDETSQEQINDLYTTNLKQDIISKIKNKGYNCENIKLKTNENYEVLEINIIGIYELKDSDEKESDKNSFYENSNNVQNNKITNSQNEKSNIAKVNSVVINEIQIGKTENNIEDQVVKGISTSEKKKLKEYLSETYNVKEKNISIS